MIKEKIANMVIDIYESESSIYYTGSLLDELKITSDNIYQQLPDYAMDCALNKIAASEMLDYVVDEGLQVHGGYGFMKDYRSEEHTSELQSRGHLVCRLLLEKKKK